MQDRIVALLNRFRFNFANELELQEGIWHVLSGAGVTAEREFQIDGNSRIDFMVASPLSEAVCPGVGIEAKVSGSPSLVTRQIHRYLSCDQLTGLVLVTSRHAHLGIPGEMCGKPVDFVYVGGRF